MKIIHIGTAKATDITLGKNTYYLLFNGNAMFEIQDKWKSVSAFFETISKGTKEGIQALIEGFIILATQGECARRVMGFDKGTIPTADMLNVMLSPHDHAAMLKACADAINLGYGREVQDEDEEIDLGLIELEKKTVHG